VPFTAEQFFDVFQRYNSAIWPAQIVLCAWAGAILWHLWRPRRRSNSFIAASLALLWTWMGAVYHLGFSRSVNPAATAFAILSFAGAAVFVWQGVVRSTLRFDWRGDGRSWTAATVLAYALLVYPAIGLALGHEYWRSPTFGAPCPTTIFTFGVLLLVRPLPLPSLIVPTLWAAVGSQAALSLGVPQDLGLPAAAALSWAVALRERLTFRAEQSGG
jgi:hypothetical protein